MSESEKIAVIGEIVELLEQLLEEVQAIDPATFDLGTWEQIRGALALISNAILLPHLERE